MEQSKEVSAPKKRANGVVDVAIDTTKGIITFAVDGVGQAVLEMGKLSESNLTYAAYHGMNQRIRDAAAIAINPDTGERPTPQDRFDAMAKLVDHYNSGATDWNVKRTEGVGRDTTAIIVQALANVWKTDAAGVIAKLQPAATRAGKPVDELVKQFGKAADVMREIAAIKAARSSVNAEDLLAELE